MTERFFLWEPVYLPKKTNKKTTYKIYLSKKNVFIIFTILIIHSLTRSLQFTWFQLPADWHKQTDTTMDITTYRLNWLKGQFSEN